MIAANEKIAVTISCWNNAIPIVITIVSVSSNLSILTLMKYNIAN